MPNVEWLEGSGLAIDDGVLTDSRGRAADQVFAVGDVARWQRPSGENSPRNEHWSAATEQGAQVGLAILDQPVRAPAPPYVWTDLFDIKVQAIGAAPTGEVTSIVSANRQTEAARFVELHANEAGRCVRAEAMNWTRAVIEVRRSLSRDAPMDQIIDAVSALGAPVILARIRQPDSGWGDRRWRSWIGASPHPCQDAPASDPGDGGGPASR
jgi:hypothetical protein